MKSIRTYLLSRLLGGSVVVLAGAAISVYFVVTQSLESEFDRNLSDRVLGFASVLFQVEDKVEFEFSDQLMPEYERANAPAYFELRFDDGRLLERSNSLGEQDLKVPVTPTAEPAHWTATLPDGRAGRFVAELVEVHHVYPEEGPKRPPAAHISVVVARGLEDLEAAESALLANIVVVSILLVAGIGLLSWRAVSRGLEPAHRLAAALDGVDVEHLPGKLNLGAMPMELRPVAEKTDALIARVETALERERRTTADIAHELRNPISELLTVSEVALRDDTDAEGPRRALGTVRDIAWRMGGLVSTLLKLARLDMGSETFDRESIDLGNLVRESGRALNGLQRDRHLRFENHVASGETVVGDSDVLRIVVSNLLSNALYYAPKGSTVACRLERDGDEWSLIVENAAADLGPEDLRHISEPFWRKDRARTDRSRSGLGLALSRALIEKSGMDLSFVLADGRFRATLANRNGTAADA